MLCFVFYLTFQELHDVVRSNQVDHRLIQRRKDAFRRNRLQEAGWTVIVFTADDVRSAMFRSRLGGYHETQVDVVLDGLVDVLLAVSTD